MATHPHPTSSPWRLTGQRIVVTGGSRGIGAGIVRTLTERGASVLAIARGAQDLAAIADQTGCETMVADVVSDHKAIVQRCLAGPVHGLVNNVGTNIRKTIADYSDDDYHRLVDINLSSTFKLCRDLLPGLQQTKGSVVNISSVSAQRAVSTSTAAYALTKGGMEGLTRFLAVKWGPLGVRVNVVAPWYIDTPLVASVLEDPVKLNHILDRTPLRRVGTSDEVGQAVAFFMMPASAWTTGVILPIDGGFGVMGT